MNKSLITNLAAIACIVVGCFSPWLSQQIISAGVFALSGAITNWLAVYMLFEKVPLIYGSGVIPLNFENLKQSIRDLVIEQFFQDEIIARFLQKNSSVIISESRMSRFLNLIDYDAVFNTVKSMVLDNGIGGFLKMLGGVSGGLIGVGISLFRGYLQGIV